MEELPGNPLSMLRLMPSKGKEVATFSYQIIKAVRDGNVDPLEVLVMLRSIEHVSELVREEIEDHILKEAEKYSEKVIERYGAKIEKAELNTRYVYKTSGDQEWERLDAEINSLQERKKDREAFLQALKEPIQVLHPETGELEEIKPPVKKSKSGVKVYLGK